MYLTNLKKIISNYYVDFLNILFFIFISLATFNQRYAKKIIIVASIFWLFSYINKEKLKYFFSNKIVITLTLLLIYMSLTLFWTHHFKHGRSLVLDYFYYFYLPILIMSTTFTQKYIKLMIQYFILIILLNEIISYGIYFHFWLSYKNGFPIYFIYHVEYSIILTLALILLSYDLINKTFTNYFYKFLIILFLFSMSVNLIISGGRSGQIVAILTIISLGLTYFKNIKKIIVILSLLLSAFILAYFTFSQFRSRTDAIYQNLDQIITSNNYDTSVGTRLFSYLLIPKYIKDYDVLLGEGSGSNYAIKTALITKYYPNIQVERYHTHFHQYYIDMLVDYGLVGLSLFILFLYYLIRIPIYNNQINFIKYTLFFIILYSNLVDRISQTRSVMLIFAFFIAIIIAQNRIESNEKKI